MHTPDYLRVFDYADRQLIVCSDILESSKLAVIAIPTGPHLIPESETGKRIIQLAGEQVERQIDILQREYKNFETGMAVFTDAGQLAYSAIVHAVSLRQQQNPPMQHIEQAYSNSLLLCEFNGWKSIAFDDLYSGDPACCASAAGKAIIRFWDARLDSALETVELHVSESDFEAVIAVIEAINAGPFAGQLQHNGNKSLGQKTCHGSPDAEIEIGELDLSNEDLSKLNDDAAISDWFGSNKDHHSKNH